MVTRRVGVQFSQQVAGVVPSEALAIENDPGMEAGNGSPGTHQGLPLCTLNVKFQKIKAREVKPGDDSVDGGQAVTPRPFSRTRLSCSLVVPCS